MVTRKPPSDLLGQTGTTQTTGRNPRNAGRFQYGTGRSICLTPPSVPDEALISDVGRYHIVHAHSTSEQTYRELYNAPPFPLNSWIPGHISRLTRHMAGDPVANTLALLQSKTLFPLFQVFSGLMLPNYGSANKKKTHEDNEDALGQGSDSIETPRRLVTEEIRICLNCLHDDLKSYGFAYIHLSHQVPGVRVCARHRTPLIVECPYCECHFTRKKDLVLALWTACHCTRLLTDFPLPKEKSGNLVQVSYARFAADLLSAEPIHVNAYTLVQGYKRRLQELGYATWGSQFERTRIFSDFEQFYGSDLIAKVDRAYREQRMSGWFNLVNEQYSPEIPLGRHLLFAHFLFRKTNLFWQYMIPYHALDLSEEANQTKSHSKGAGSDEPKRRTSASLKKESRLKELRREVMASAKEIPNCTIGDLWKHKFRTMTWLMRRDPMAVPWLKEQLATVKPRTHPKRPSLLEAHPKDGEIAEAIRMSAEQLYASVEKPVRVSANFLLKDIPWNASAPNATRFPASQRILKEEVESNWHFYARRVVWAILHGAVVDTAIRNKSGVEYERAKALAAYFSGLMGRPVAMEKNTILNVLAKYGIDKHWQGPCPDRQFLSPGRAYRKKG